MPAAIPALAALEPGLTFVTVYPFEADPSKDKPSGVSTSNRWTAAAGFSSRIPANRSLLGCFPFKA